MARRHRQRLGWTQEELARRSGLSVRSVRAIERGAVRPRESSLRRLTAVLGAPADDVLSVGVLGPLVVRRGGVELSVRAPMPRALLGLLALHPGRLVSQAEIVDVLWDSQPPAAAEQVRVHVAGLRSLLGVDRSVIVGGPLGGTLWPSWRTSTTPTRTGCGPSSARSSALWSPSDRLVQKRFGAPRPSWSAPIHLYVPYCFRYAL